MRLSRSWLILLYLLATVLAQGSHDHGREDEGGTSQHEAGCSDPRPHVAGHPSPETSDDHDHCVACQFRADHHGWLLTPFCLDRPVESPLADSAHTSSSVTSARWNTCRAPPEREAA